MFIILQRENKMKLEAYLHLRHILSQRQLTKIFTRLCPVNEFNLKLLGEKTNLILVKRIMTCSLCRHSVLGFPQLTVHFPLSTLPYHLLDNESY